MRHLILGTFLICTAGLAPVYGQQDRLPLKFTVTAGSAERTDAAARVSLLPTIVRGKNLRLFETTGGQDKPVASQIDVHDNGLWWIVEGKLAAGQTRTYRLESGSRAVD